jgi:hypothetical protein
VPPKLSKYLNRNVLVSIPALFEDGRCRAYTLRGVELHGVWLDSDELVTRLAPDQGNGVSAASPLVFVPFSQVAAVILVTAAQPDQTPLKADEKPAQSTSTRAKGDAPTKADSSTATRKKT